MNTIQFSDSSKNIKASKLMKAIKTFAPYALIISAILFFVLFRSYVVSILWNGRVTPPEPDDSLGYLARVRILGDKGSFFFDLKYISSWNKNDQLAFLPWNTGIAIVSQFNSFYYVNVYEANFYFGLIVLSLVTLNLLKVLERDKLFWIVAISFLALYNGSGEYHGFFWVVPSFYSVVWTFLLISLIFGGQNTFRQGKTWPILFFLIIFLLVWSHPLGEFSYLAILFSFVTYMALSRILHARDSSFPLRRVLIVVLISGAIAIFFLEVLPYWLGVVPYTYPSGIQLLTARSNGFAQFRTVYLDFFPFNSYSLIFLVIGLFASLLNRKPAIISLYLGFFSVSLVSSLFNELGQRMLVYLWPLTFLVYSYGFYFLLRKFVDAWKKSSGQDIKIKLKESVWSKQLRLNGTAMLLGLLIVLVSFNYVIPFVQTNYDWNMKSASAQRERMIDWQVDKSIVSYLTNVTKPSDLLIFADTEAFLTTTSLGLMDRLVTYADWNWCGDYGFLRNQVNESYLVATRSPYREEIMKRSLMESTLNLRDAFEGKLTFFLVKNFGILSVYKVIVGQKESSYPFVYPDNNPMIVTDDLQASFWSKTDSIAIVDDNETQISGDSDLKISLSQQQKGQNDFIWHLYGSPQNWSDKDVLKFYWYGNGSGKGIEILIYAPDISHRLVYVFQDNSIGWNQVVALLKDFKPLSENASWSNVQGIYFRFLMDSPYVETFHIDKLLVDVVSSDEISNGSLVSGDFPSLSIFVTFFALFIPSGLMWAFFVFRVRDFLALIAVSFGLSLSLVFIAIFFINLVIGTKVSVVSATVVILVLSALPPVFHFSKKLRKTSLRLA